MLHIMTQDRPQVGKTPLKTAADVRAELDRYGMTIRDLAREIGVSDRVLYDLLRGRYKGRRGQAHRAAVVLGMKDGVLK